MLFRQLFDAETSTYTYLLADVPSGEAVLVDAVLEQVDRDLGLIAELGLRLVAAVDTHVHADHVTGLGVLKARTGCTTVLSERAGSAFADRLVKHGDRVQFGSRSLEVRETPGHTSGCLTYVLDDHSMAFTGDALLVRGTGRTDFQQGDPRVLYRSITTQLFTLPDACFLYPGHDYKGRTVTTVAEEKRHNPRVGGGKTEDEFAAIMDALVLAQPKKIDVAVPANLLCGVPRTLPANLEGVGERGWAPIEVTVGGVPEVVPEWLAAHAGEVRIVDVRERDEYTGPLGHIHGADLVPLAGLTQGLEGSDKDAPLVLVCRSGGRSGKGALELLAQGYRRVVSMRGGMTLWNQRGLPSATN